MLRLIPLIFNFALQGKKSAAAAGSGSGDASSAPAPSAPPVKKLPPAAATKPSKGAPAPAAGSLDSFKFKHTAEDADALAAELVPENFAAGLSDSNWKTRLATLEEMTGWVESMAESLDSEVLVRFLGKKGWAEKNFQVSLICPGCDRRAQGRITP